MRTYTRICAFLGHIFLYIYRNEGGFQQKLLYVQYKFPLNLAVFGTIEQKQLHV
jgi:hypothetical protein